MDNDHLQSILPERMPDHIGIIMDGNGRWARKRGLARSQGHREGLEATKRVVKQAADIGLKFLSVFTFSTENWRRAEEEISFLMFLVKHHLRKEYDFYRENRIRIVHSGDIMGLPEDVREEVMLATENTRGFTGLTVNIALNYGGRDEIIRAVNRWLGSDEFCASDHPVLTSDSLPRYMDCDFLPDPDLIIRTGGEFRISNFLLWQSAYAELYFSDKLWPDWVGEDLVTAILDYQRRERRFGGVK